MKKALRMTCFVLSMLLIMTAFAGCASPQQTALTGEEQGANSKIVMGTNAQFPPFEFVEQDGLVDGMFSGIDVEIALAIAKELKRDLTINDMSFDSLIAALQGGSKVDFVAAGMTANDERRLSVDFSDTYYVATQGIIVPANSTITAASQLKDKKVGAVVGYTGEKLCREELKVTNLVSFKRGVDAVMELKNGKLDAVVIDLQPAKNFIKSNNDIKVVEDPYFEAEEYAIAVQKGNTELLATINKVLNELKTSGKLDEIIQKYDGEGESE